MLFTRAARSLLMGLTIAGALGGAARAAPLGACIWSGLPSRDQTTILDAYNKDMAAGAAALDKRAAKLRAQAARCAARRDIAADRVQAMAGAEGVQAFTARALLQSKGLQRRTLDAAWAAAPATVAACVRATARVAYFPNGLGCTDPAAPAWLLKRLGLDPRQQPAARQALYYFNAKAIGEWGDKLVAGLPARPRR